MNDVRTHLISLRPLSLKRAYRLAMGNYQLALSKDATQRIENCRTYLNQKTAHPEQTFYGINTGFGSLCEVRIPDEDLEQLQYNLLVSHACGMGEEVPPTLVKLMLLLKIQGLAQGYSGVQLATVQRLIDFFNHNLLPVVYEQGSLGASGDLAPLAHLSLPLIGLGELKQGEQRHPAAEVLNQQGWQPLGLQSKEGLALINGTQFMSAYAVWCVRQAQALLEASNLIAVLSLEGFGGRTEPFHPLIHRIRKQKGQVEVAQTVLRYLKNSELAQQPKTQVQDPYSFRCVPQVHGASSDAINHVEKIVRREINGVTDNPNVFVEEDWIVSGGNFHGQPLALTLDYLAIALAELGSISERRLYLLLDWRQGLPPFLIENSGLNSGLMIAQYTAASIVSQNKQYCTPASVDSIISSKGQEDHVSMGANAATKCYRVVENVQRILAIELMAAAQALDFRKQQTGLTTSPTLEKLLQHYRQTIPYLTADRVLHTDLSNSLTFIQEEIGQYLR